MSRPKNKEPVTPYVKGMCKWCGKYPLPKRRRTYCSDSCAQRYAHWDWEHTVWGGIRNRIMRRDGFRCTRCGYVRSEFRKVIESERNRLFNLLVTREAGTARDYIDGLRKMLTGLEVHHILPRALGGGDEDTNLITLCSRCHDRPEYHKGIPKNRRLKRGK